MCTLPCAAAGMEAFGARMKYLEDLRLIGSRGHGVFADVPGYQCVLASWTSVMLSNQALYSSVGGCRYDTFYHFPVAHALLYGVCKDFWKLVLRKKSDVLPRGDEVWLDKDDRAHMTALFNTLRVTSSFSSAAKDITQCVS